MSSVRRYKINLHPPSSIHIQICDTPGLAAENLSLGTWGSSFVLANLLHKWAPESHQSSQCYSGHERSTSDVQCTHDGKQEKEPESFSVLELGSGTSLVGLTASVLWSPQRVMTTDLAALIPGLEQNISLNEQLLSSAGAKMSCGVLDWANPTELQLRNNPGPHQDDGDDVASMSRALFPSSTTKPTTILAADTLYDSPHPELLTSVVKTWLAPGPESRVILCYPLRHAYIEIFQDFWERFEAAGLHCVEEGRQDADPDQWDDVAPYEWCVWKWRDAVKGQSDRKERVPP